MGFPLTPTNSPEEAEEQKAWLQSLTDAQLDCILTQAENRIKWARGKYTKLCSKRGIFEKLFRDSPPLSETPMNTEIDGCLPAVIAVRSELASRAQFSTSSYNSVYTPTPR